LNSILYNWGLGIGDWGLGIGDWGLGPIPNPQSPEKLFKIMMNYNQCYLSIELNNNFYLI